MFYLPGLGRDAAGGVNGERDEELLHVPVAAGADRQRSRSFDPAAVDPSVGSEAAAAALKIMVPCLSPSLSLSLSLQHSLPVSYCVTDNSPT